MMTTCLMRPAGGGGELDGSGVGGAFVGPGMGETDDEGLGPGVFPPPVLGYFGCGATAMPPPPPPPQAARSSSGAATQTMLQVREERVLGTTVPLCARQPV